MLQWGRACEDADRPDLGVATFYATARFNGAAPVRTRIGGGRRDRAGGSRASMGPRL